MKKIMTFALLAAVAFPSISSAVDATGRGNLGAPGSAPAAGQEKKDQTLAIKATKGIEFDLTLDPTVDLDSTTLSKTIKATVKCNLNQARITLQSTQGGLYRKSTNGTVSTTEKVGYSVAILGTTFAPTTKMQTSNPIELKPAQRNGVHDVVVAVDEAQFKEANAGEYTDTVTMTLTGND